MSLTGCVCVRVYMFEYVNPCKSLYSCCCFQGGVDRLTRLNNHLNKCWWCLDSSTCVQITYHIACIYTCINFNQQQQPYLYRCRDLNSNRNNEIFIRRCSVWVRWYFAACVSFDRVSFSFNISLSLLFYTRIQIFQMYIVI